MALSKWLLVSFCGIAVFNFLSFTSLLHLNVLHSSLTGRQLLERADSLVRHALAQSWERYETEVRIKKIRAFRCKVNCEDVKEFIEKNGQGEAEDVKPSNDKQTTKTDVEKKESLKEVETDTKEINLHLNHKMKATMDTASTVGGNNKGSKGVDNATKTVSILSDGPLNVTSKGAYTPQLEPGWENRPLATQGASFVRYNHDVATTTLYEKYPQLREPVNADLRSYYERKFHKKQKMKHCDNEQGNVLPGCVFVIGDTLTSIFRMQWEQTPDTKIAAFDIMFDAVMKRMAPQLKNKNISFALELRANGTLWITRRRRFEPLLTLAQRGLNVGGLSGLVPNPYFLNPEWWDTYTHNMAKAAQKKPFETRKPHVLFRGACGPGGQERIRLMLQRESDPRLDVGFSRTLGFNNSVADCIHKVGAKMGIPQQDLETLAQRGKSAMMSQDDFSSYQYIVHMPGAATGAYSRGLQYLFMHGSIVLIWENDSIEFYYHQLVPRKHFMPVNDKTLKGVLDELESDPELRRTLLEGAKEVLHHIVSAESVYKRWEAALVPILDRQTSPMVLPEEVCTCKNNTGLQRCKHCRYVDFLQRRVRRKPDQPELFDYSKW